MLDLSVAMALTASSSCTPAVSSLLASDGSVSSPKAPSGGVVPLPAKPKFQSAGLKRTKSRKPVKNTKARAGVQDAVPTVEQSLESTVTQAVNKVSEEIATTSSEILDAVDSVIEDGPVAMRVRKNAGKVNSRISRRRALVTCLALGMVRPCVSNIESNSKQSNDLRRTSSAMPGIRRTTSSSFKVPLVSQVSLATAMKQTNLLGEQEDLQKLTTLQ